MVTRYFDGAASAGSCGVGMVLLVNSSQSYRLRMDVGYGLNTKSELLALWGLLHFALHKNYQTLHVHEDSKVIIEWVKGIYYIRFVELEHWLIRTKFLIKQFNSLSFQHIYREFNSLVDDLSKRAIVPRFKKICWWEFLDDALIESGTLSLF